MPDRTSPQPQLRPSERRYPILIFTHTLPFLPSLPFQLLIVIDQMHWHAALTTSFCLGCKVFHDGDIKMSDVREHFTSRYSKRELIAAESRAFSLMLPHIASISTRARIFRNKLIDVILCTNSEQSQRLSSLRSTGKEARRPSLHVLIIDHDAVTSHEHAGMVQSLAPGSRTHCVSLLSEAMEYVDTEEKAGRSVSRAHPAGPPSRLHMRVRTADGKAIH
mgnify:CR=1 FL=1